MRSGRSRLRGAKRGFLIGAAVGVLAGLAITDDFYNDRAVNVVIGAGTIGVVGAGIGALIGVGGAAPH
ncbi:MAG TPA: hypothetical protein VFJ74_03410 [Gemmatimonadaceae bacterium]|nr:hypothetical protein [Gemmatimonadaceae bacterium]